MLSKMKWWAGSYLRYLFELLGKKRKYRISGYAIQLDADHKLPAYQRDHPYYDKFLPHLVKHLPANTLVVDVGANVGDTLVGMISSNDKLHYLCVEASNHFFSDLKKNTRLLKEQNQALRITLSNDFVGNELTNVALEGQGGTKHAVQGAGSIRSKTLTALITEHGLTQGDISLLKSDVDGFDWDVIRSSYEVLIDKPYVYFECQYDNLEQLNSYREVITEMRVLGYSRFSFFDNFGQFVVSTDNPSVIDDLLNYVARQNFHQGTRTYFYYDILAHSAEKADEVYAILDAYNAYLN